MILVHITDLHIRPLGLAAYRTAETNMLTERALRAVSRLKQTPDAVVITGDLTDNGLESEYSMLSEMLGRLIKVPVYVIPGNHDRREVLKTQLKHLPGVSDHPKFVQYTAMIGPYRLVMLDTLIPGNSAGELCADRLAWLDETLAAAPSTPTIVGLHHPPFACGIKHMDAIALRDPASFIAIIAKYPQVKRIICGHHHRPITAQVAHTIASIGPSAAHQVEFTLGDDTGAWTLEPAAFHILTDLPNDGLINHTVYVEDFPGPFPFIPDPDYPGRP